MNEQFRRRSSPEEPPLSRDEVKRRAGSGVLVVGLRGVAVRLVQMGALVVLARLLTPRDFGLIAFGSVFVGLASLAVDSGLGATLIRRRDAPDRADLESLLGLQLTVSTALAATVALVSIPFGKAGAVTAVMVSTLPLIALRTPGVVVLERRLDYRPIFLSDLAETVIYSGFAIGGAESGWGVWALAVAMLPRSLAGSAVIAATARDALVRPRLQWLRIRSMLSFGLRLQAVGLVNTVRDQGLNAGIAGISGEAVLGVWSFAYRILQIPFILFGALWRVSFPAMSRLAAAGEDLSAILNRGVGLAAVATGAILAPLTASIPALVPSLLGAKWHRVVDIVPYAALGLMISGPISVAVAGYLYATGDAGTPLRATVWHTVASLAVTFSLLPVLAARAIGIGVLASSFVDAVLLGRGAARASGADIVGPLLLPTLLAAAGAGAGWVIASAAGASVGLAALAAAAAEAIYLGGLLLIQRGAVLDLWAVAGRIIRGSAA